MASNFFKLMKLLEDRRIHFAISRASPFAVMLHVTMIGKRIEITVDEDDIVDVCIFRGSEDVDVGMDAVMKALEEDR